MVNRNAVKPMVFRKCKQCGKEFRVYLIPLQKFCSRKCAYEYRKEHGWMPKSFSKGKGCSITRWKRGNHIEATSTESE